MSYEQAFTVLVVEKAININNESNSNTILAKNKGSQTYRPFGSPYAIHIYITPESCCIN